jgi:hypothetical protein
MEGDNKVSDHSFQVTTESLEKTHRITYKYVSGVLSYDEDREVNFDMRFNKKPQSVDIKSMDDVESITILGKHRYEKPDILWNTGLIQYEWKMEMESLIKKLDHLEVVLKYEHENMNQMSGQRIGELNQKITQYRTEIQRIKNESVVFDYQNILEVKHITLPRSKLGRLDFYSSYGTGGLTRGIDFYWNTNQLTDPLIFIDQVENLTQIDEHVTYHQKHIPKLSLGMKQKYEHYK